MTLKAMPDVASTGAETPNWWRVAGLTDDVACCCRRNRVGGGDGLAAGRFQRGAIGKDLYAIIAGSEGVVGREDSLGIARGEGDRARVAGVG